MNPTTFPYQEGSAATFGNRADQMRRDDDVVKISKVTLFDIDYAIFYHITENVNPKILENGTSIPVPVMFANGEKWSQIRQYGFLRDSSKKVLAPVIVLRRTNTVTDDRFPRINTNLGGVPKTRVIPYKTTGMQYDKTSGQYVSKDSYEFYIQDSPNYVRITYDMILWCDLQEQMNALVQPFISISDHVWGDYHKFRTKVMDITHDNVNVPGEDRLIKTTISLQVDGFLRSEYDYHKSKIQKAYSLKKVRFLEEGSDQIVFGNEDEFSTSNPTITNDSVLRRNPRL